MKRQAPSIPLKTTVSNNAPRHMLQIGDYILIVYVKDASGRQHLMPMRHQRLVLSVIAAKFGQIVSVVLLFGEKLGKT